MIDWPKYFGHTQAPALPIFQAEVPQTCGSVGVVAVAGGQFLLGC
jgi:hypothetical protein